MCLAGWFDFSLEPFALRENQWNLFAGFIRRVYFLIVTEFRVTHKNGFCFSPPQMLKKKLLEPQIKVL